MRSDIDTSPKRMKNVLMGANLRKAFLKGAPKQESKVVKAFVAANAENALKTKPKGYAADHIDIALLRLRNYTIGTKLAEDELFGHQGMERITNLFIHMKPFITYLNSVVMPDAQQDETDEDTESEAGTTASDGDV